MFATKAYNVITMLQILAMQVVVFPAKQVWLHLTVLHLESAGIFVYHVDLNKHLAGPCNMLVVK